MLADRAAPLDAVARPLAGDLRAVLGDADADRRQRQAARVQRRERDLEALALLADQVLLRDEDVLEARDRVLDAAQAHELVAALDGDAVRRVVEHANLAYHASWCEAQKTAKEVWSPPPNLPADYISQKEASFKFNETMQAFLIDNADVREAQRLRRVAQSHACGFITAVPSDEDGKETLLRPRNFQIAVAYRLGIQDIPCPLCR